MTDKKEEKKEEKKEDKKDQGSDSEEDDEGADVATMSGGDYSIHIFIERGKNFIGDPDKTSIKALF